MQAGRKQGKGVAALSGLVEAGQQLAERAEATLPATIRMGDPSAILGELSEEVERFREAGLPALFESDGEMRRFYRTYLELILARLLVLQNASLEMVTRKVLAGGDELSLTMLKDLLAVGGKLLNDMGRMPKPDDGPMRSPEELAGEIADKEAQLRELENR